MQKIACKYVILRFTPYSQTEEFANVGVVLYSKAMNIFQFKVDRVDAGNRVAKFFHIDDKRFYKEALTSYEKELKYMHELVQQNEVSAEYAFNMLVRPRATLFSYGTARAILTSDVKTSVNDIFNRMVRHSADEQVIARSNLYGTLKSQLDMLQLERPFRLHSFTKDGFVAKYNLTQLGSEDLPFKIIHPIDLTNKTSPNEAWNIIDKNESRLNRMRQLELLPEEVLIPYSLSDDAPSEVFHVWKSVKSELTSFGKVVSIEDTDSIKEFAIY